MKPPSVPKPRASLDSIQAFRGIAALSVVIHHAFDASPLPGGGNPLASWFDTTLGAAGVDLFFIISGFIMVYTTRTKPMTGVEFLKHRITRIFPLYWFCILVTLLLHATPWFQTIGEVIREPVDHLKSFFLYPSTIQVGQDVLLRPRPVLQGWTLVFEMVFYCVFALSLTLRAERRLPFACLTVAALFGLGQFLPAREAWTLVLGENIILEFVFGMLLAHYFLKPDFSLSKGVAKLLLWLGFCGYAVFALIPSYARECPRLLALGVPSLLVISSVLLFKDTPKRWPRILLHLGNASYSLYLVHVLIFELCDAGKTRIPMLSRMHWSGHVLMLTVSALIGGFVLYRLVEDPLSRFFRRVLGRA